MDPLGAAEDEAYEQALERRIQQQLPSELQSLYWTDALPSEPLPTSWSSDPVGTHRAVRIRHATDPLMGDFVLCPTALGQALIDAVIAAKSDDEDRYFELVELVIHVLRIRARRSDAHQVFSPLDRYEKRTLRAVQADSDLPRITHRTFWLIGAVSPYSEADHGHHLVDTIEADY